MEPDGTTRRSRRRGRPALLAAAVVLTLGAVGLVAERLAGPSGGPIASPSTVDSAGTPGANAVPGATALTTGPLMSTSPPTRVSIPSLAVTSTVVDLGLRPDGTMEVPDGADAVGWFVKAPTPGSLGPAVLAGHVNWKSRDGAFAGLHTLRAGDPVNVARRDGTVAMFEVTKVERYAKDRFPTDAVYGAIDHAGLRLITCGGEFDSDRGSYQDNIVVYAALRHAHPAA
jgi:hypothetical protein